MLVTESPNKMFTGDKTMFLAGGITNCPNWQKDLITMLEVLENKDGMEWALQVFNPRRENFPIHDPDAAFEQIEWEYERLALSDIIIFWFSRGSLNPIVLYELGMWGNSREDKEIIIGIDPAYERKQDVIIQTKLANPDTVIVSSLSDMALEVKKAFLK